MFKKRKKNNKLFWIIIFIFLGMMNFYVYQNHLKNQEQIEEKTDNTKVLDTISEILELNTIKYNYNNLITVKKDKTINDIKLPFTEKSFIIKYEGIISGGVKSENIKILSSDNENIHIQINKCEILGHYIKDDSIFVYNTKESLFNKIEVQEVLDDITINKKEYEKKVLEEGFLDEIKESVSNSLTMVLNSLGYESVEIQFLE